MWGEGGYRTLTIPHPARGPNPARVVLDKGTLDAMDSDEARLVLYCTALHCTVLQRTGLAAETRKQLGRNIAMKTQSPCVLARAREGLSIVVDSIRFRLK